MNDLTLVGERVLDLSPRGAMIACDEQMTVGEELMVSLRAPWLGPHIVLLAVVTRVIEGWRDGDPGYCAGVRFIEQDIDARRELRARLRPFPLVASARRYPTDYAETVRRVHAGF